MTPIERASAEELRGNTREKDAYMKLSVLAMLGEGKSYEEISVLLGLSRGSIANCRGKFGDEGLDKF